MGHAILERVLLFGTRSADYIRASGHNGCIATEVTLQATTEAEYMTAPERFADSQIPLAPRAPSKWRVHRSSRDHVDSCSGGRAITCHAADHAKGICFAGSVKRSTPPGNCRLNSRSPWSRSAVKPR